MLSPAAALLLPSAGAEEAAVRAGVFVVVVVVGLGRVGGGAGAAFGHAGRSFGGNAAHQTSFMARRF